MLVAFVLVLSVLLGCCGLALDIGLLELKQVQLQNAADAAALEATFQMEQEDTGTSASAIADYTAAAVAGAAENGFVNNVNGVTVVVHMPPTAGLYAANQAAVQVLVSQPVSTIFKAGSYTKFLQGYWRRTAMRLLHVGEYKYLHSESPEQHAC